jgi:hypothetical protein
MLARFERLMEEAVEGGLRRIFPTPLQPVQLAKAAARAMEQSQVVGVRGAEVPNHYQLRLASDDLARFGAYTHTLTWEVSRYLANYARDRHLRPVAALRVELIEDSTLRAGSVRASARFVDLAPAAQREIEAAVEGTRRLRLAQLASATGSVPRISARPQLRIVDRKQEVSFPLEPETDVVRIGRATDNDVVLANHRVSRYHAQVRWVESSWLVYDLNSTNGTWLDGRRVAGQQPEALRGGAQLRLGDHELEIAADEAIRGPV